MMARHLYQDEYTPQVIKMGLEILTIKKPERSCRFLEQKFQDVVGIEPNEVWLGQGKLLLMQLIPNFHPIGGRKKGRVDTNWEK